MHKLHPALAISAAAATVALACALTPTAAFASSTPQPTPTPAAGPAHNDPTKLAQITVAPSGPNVTSLTFAAPSTNGGPNPYAIRSSGGVLQGSGTKQITPPNGTKGGLYDAFSSTVTLTPYSVKLHGSSQGIWEGVKPVNATKITLQDQISASGTSISVGIGVVGGTFAPGGGSWICSSSASNNYILSHSYSGLEWDGTIMTIGETSQFAASFNTALFVQITN